MTTGPLTNTVGEFWRMIWENELPTIVMLTKCFEGRVSTYTEPEGSTKPLCFHYTPLQVKCQEYWPVNIGESISPCHDLTITLTAVLPFTDYSIRKMTVTHVS